MSGTAQLTGETVVRSGTAQPPNRLSQDGRELTHPGRDIDQEELCTTVALTIAARGSEDTPATLTTANAERSSTATAVSITSIPRAVESMASAAKDTAWSLRLSGSAYRPDRWSRGASGMDVSGTALERLRLFVGQRVYQLGVRLSRIGGAICGPGRQW